MPGFSIRQPSRSNSFAVSSSPAPSTVTSRASRSSTIESSSSVTFSAVCSERRRIALIRAAISRGENGFVT